MIKPATTTRTDISIDAEGMVHSCTQWRRWRRGTSSWRRWPGWITRRHWGFQQMRALRCCQYRSIITCNPKQGSLVHPKSTQKKITHVSVIGCTLRNVQFSIWKSCENIGYRATSSLPWKNIRLRTRITAQILKKTPKLTGYTKRS